MMAQPVSDQVEDELVMMVEKAGVGVKSVYTPAEVQSVLQITRGTFNDLCNAWEPAHHKGRNPKGLRAMELQAQRRVSYAALLEWLRENYRR